MKGVKKRTLLVLVKNHFGVMSHITGLFTRRGYNIDSISVGETEDPKVSTITLVVEEEEQMVEQIKRQLYKLVDVLHIEDLTEKETLSRELLLVVLHLPKGKRQEILLLLEVFQAKIVDMTPETVMVELIGEPRRVSTFLQAVKEYGIISMARTGTVALPLPSAEY